MDSATTLANAPARAENSARTQSKSAPTSAESKGKKSNTAPEPKPADYGVTVRGRFDPDLRRFFVTILDTSSGSLIVQFPSQAAAQYAQQLVKAAGKGESLPKDTDIEASRELRLDQRT